MTILITGANGFIGTNLHEFLENKKDGVFQPKWINLGRQCKGHTGYPCDLSDIRQVKEVINNIRPETIIHLAGYSTSKPSDDKSKAIRENIIATQNLLEALPEDKKTNFIFASSILVYGTESRKEDELCKPTSVYGMTKIACEDLLNIYAHKLANKIIFRLCAVVGEKHMTHGMLYDFFNKFQQESLYPVELIGCRPGSIKPFLHVEDVCRAIWQCITSTIYGGVYNLCPNDNMSVEDVALRVHYAYGDPGRRLVWNSDKVWKGDINKISFDNSKFTRDFFAVQSSIEAINKVVDNYDWNT